MTGFQGGYTVSTDRISHCGRCGCLRVRYEGDMCRPCWYKEKERRAGMVIGFVLVGLAFVSVWGIVFWRWYSNKGF